MSIKDEYLTYRDSNNLKTGNFGDRVKLQNYLREKLEKIWDEDPIFSNGGLLTNYMTGYALGFPYYDCRPSSFCKTRCYGLPISGQYDYNMLRLSVITSESFKTGDRRYLNVLYDHLRKLHLSCLKIGHWGDAVLEKHRGSHLHMSRNLFSGVSHKKVGPIIKQHSAKRIAYSQS